VPWWAWLLLGVSLWALAAYLVGGMVGLALGRRRLELELLEELRACAAMRRAELERRARGQGDGGRSSS
jgi:hypothetical protein